MIQQSLVISNELLVIDIEISNTAVKALEGIKIDQDRLASQAIAKVGPGGNFLEALHTIEFLRAAWYTPSLLSRDSRENWNASGNQEFIDRAKDVAMKILRDHEIEPMPNNVAKELDDDVNTALKSLKK